MGTYNEKIASHFTANMRTMSTHQAQNAQKYIDGYLAQQEENMLPPWPAQLEAKAAEAKRVRDIFADLKTVDTHYPQFNPKASVDPDLSRKMIANSVFIARHARRSDGSSMQPHEVAESRELLRDTVAKQLFSAAGPMDDATFYSMAQGHMTKENKATEGFDKAQRAGLEDAYLGNGTDDGVRYKKWSDEAKAAGHYNTDTEEAYTNTNKAIRRSIAPFQEDIDFAIKAVANHMGVADDPKARPIAEVLNFLIELPVPARNAVFNAITLRARKLGEEVGENKGVKVVEGSHELGVDLMGPLRQIGESFARTIGDRFSTSKEADAVLEDISNAETTRLVEGASVADLINYQEAEYSERTSGGLSSSVLDFYGGKAPIGEQRELTYEEKKALSVHASKGKVALQLARKLDEVSRTLDPTPSIMASTVGSSIAFIGDVAILGPYGLATSAWGLANIEYDQLRTEYPTMSTEAAANVATVSGLLQAPVELLQGSLLLGKVPFLKDLLKGATTNTLVKQGIVRVGANAVVQNAGEGIQDATTPIVQHFMRELDANVQGIDIEAKMAEWWGGRADVAIGMIPLLLIGVTTGTVQDIKQHNLFNILHEDQVRRTGVSEEVVVAVGEARAKGDLQGAVNALRAGWGTATKERAQEHTQAVLAKQAEDGMVESETELMVERLQRSGAAPKFAQLEDGSVQVQMPDNSLFVVPDFTSAGVQVSRWYDEQENKDIHEVKALAAEFADRGAPDLGLPGELRETFTVAGKPQTTQQDVEQKLATPEEVAIGVMDAGARLGVTPEQATEDLNMVFGRNATEVKDNIAHSASTVYDGASVLDVVRETVGGRVKAALTTGAKKLNDFRRVIDNVFEATGIQFLKGETEAHMVEAMGHLAAADVLGRRKDVGGIGGATQDVEGKVTPGSITKGLSALLDKVGNNSARGKDVSRSKYILDTFRAFFKTVFQHAQALKKAHARGKISVDSRNTLDQLLGVDTQQRHINAVLEEAKGFMAEDTTDATTDTAPTTYSIGSQEMVNRVTDGLRVHMTNPQKRIKLMSSLLSRIETLGTTDYSSNEHSTAAIFNHVRHEHALRDAENTHTTEVAEIKQKADVDVAALGIDRVFDAEQATRDAETINQTRHNKAEIDHLNKLNIIDDQADEAGWSKEAKAIHKQQVREEKARWKAKTDVIKAEHKLRITSIKLRGEGKFKEAKAAALAHRDMLVAEADNTFTLTKHKLEARLKFDDASNEAQSDKAKVHHDQLAAFRLLDAAVLAFPKSVRGALGPMTNLAGATTNEARAKQIKAKATKLMEAFDEQLHKDLTEGIERIIKKGVANIAEAGAQPKSATDADTHQMFVHIKRAAEATQMEQEGLILDQDRIINSPNSSPEQAALAEMTKLYIEAVGAMSMRTSAELEAAHKDLALLLKVKTETALTKRLAEKKARDEYAEQARLLLQLGKQAGGIGRWLFDMLSFDQAFTRLLGNNSFTHSLVDRERNADIALSTEMRSIETRLNHLLETMAIPVRNLKSGFTNDRTLAGQQLRKHFSADKTITPPSQFIEEIGVDGDIIIHEIPILDKEGKPQLLTQMEAVQAVMMFRQADGRRHMKGHGWRGENKANWNYDEKWVGEVEKQLSPEAKEVMKFLTQEYADLHKIINPLYRERYGVNLPLINLYAPLTLQGAGSHNAAVSIDPMTGVSLSGKSIMGVNPFKTRSSSAVAKPRLDDAMTTFLGRQREVRHWVHFYDLAKDMQAAFDNLVAEEAIVASNGKGAAIVVKQHLERIYTGGVDTKELSAVSKAIGRAASNRAASLILGNIQTLLVQPSQTVASAFHMTLAEYTSRLARLGTSISLRKARDSRLMQFRMASLTPVQMAQFQEITDVIDPNVLGRVQEMTGKALNSADAYSTMVTYAIVHDHQTLLARRVNPNATQEEIDAIAHNNTERLVEQTAQPLRGAQRSMFELQHSEGAWRTLWPFASEARQKLMFTYEAARLFPEDKPRAARAVSTFVAMSAVAQVARASWATLKGNADEDTWDWKTLILYAPLKNVASGVPGLNTVIESGSLFKPLERTLGNFEDILDGDASIQDVRDILQGLSFIDPRISGATTLLNPLVDISKVFDNTTE